MTEFKKDFHENVLCTSRKHLVRLFLILIGLCVAFVYYFIFVQAGVGTLNDNGYFISKDLANLSEHGEKLSVISNEIQSSNRINHNKSMYRSVNPLLKFSDNRELDSNLYFRKQTYVTDRFQPVTNHEVWIYSAYFDKIKNKSVVKVIGIALLTKVSIYCHLNDSGNVTVTESCRVTYQDSHQRVTNSVAVYILCNLQEESRPQFVSITTSKTEVPINQLVVQYPGLKVRNITVCHPALYGPFNEPALLIQAIELNRALGADHTFIYNYSVSESTNYVLKKYIEDGILTVLQWPLPSMTNAWYHAQSAAINDCVHRNINVSEYVVILDLDEYIIPVNRSSWMDLFQDINNDYYENRPHEKPTLGAMIFESCVFLRKPPDDEWKIMKKKFSITEEEEDIITRYSLLPFLYTERSEPPYKYPERSKPVVRPDMVFTAGIHQIVKHRTNSTTVTVSHKMAIINHYSSSRMDVGLVVQDVSVLRLNQLLFPHLQSALSKFSYILP